MGVCNVGGDKVNVKYAGGMGLGCLFVLGLVLLIWSLGTAVIFYAWNLVLAPMFDLSMVLWWQAFLIMLLISFIGGAFKTTVSKSE